MQTVPFFANSEKIQFCAFKQKQENNYITEIKCQQFVFVVVIDLLQSFHLKTKHCAIDYTSTGGINLRFALL